MSNEIKKYGSTKEEEKYRKMHVCRDIVKEVLDFGINEDQKKQIIKLLALELENVQLMKNLCSVIKENNEKSATKLIYND